MSKKVVSAPEAVSHIQDGDTLCNAGFVGCGVPDFLLQALETRFLDSGFPQDLTILFAAGQGDGKFQGLNRIAHEKLIKRVIGGHWGLIPKMGKLALSNKIEAYNLPQGCISQLYRDTAAGKPGTLSKVGIGTFVDPRQDGGKINETTQEDIVELMEIMGEEWLMYKAQPIDVAFIRATTADTEGNLTMEREALTLDGLAMAMAARNSGGKVIAQVERVCSSGSLNPRDVRVPGMLVDYVVIAEPDFHQQTYATPYSPVYSCEISAPLESLSPMPLDARKVIARRSTWELSKGDIVNLGIGMPEGVANIAAEEHILQYATLTAEPGIVGGIPASGLDFGAATNAAAVIDQNQQFDFYDGGGLDLACLGLAQCDQHGNINVSRFGPKLAGAGGFINISQNAHKVIFAGTFTCGGLDIAIADGELKILQEGSHKKFISQVEQITFSGIEAIRKNTPTLYVTERCVFELTPEGLELTEVAPGIDIEKDILAHMDFEPIVRAPSLMPAALFRAEPMGLLNQFERTEKATHESTRIEPSASLHHTQ